MSRIILIPTALPTCVSEAGSLPRSSRALGSWRWQHETPSGNREATSHDLVGNPLFCSETLDGHLSKIGRAAATAVQNLSCEDILRSTPEETLASVLDAYETERTRLKRDTTRSRQTEMKIDVQNDFMRGGPHGRPVYVDGVTIELITNFTGPNVFALQPSTFTTSTPCGYVQDDTIVVGCCIPMDVLERDRDEAAQEMRRAIDRIEAILQHIEVDTYNWESQLHDLLRQKIETRRDNCLAMQETSRLLGVHTEDDSADTTTYTVPIPRLQPRKSASPPRTREPSSAEPRISDEDFASIIANIQRTLALFERLPRGRVRAPEEHLRDEIITALQPLGPATGESYSKRGKSDIYLPHAGQAVFLAECKWWPGKKTFAEKALPQLLDQYVIWRDTHTAMILFIQNKNATKVIHEAIDAIRSHPRYVTEPGRIGDVPTFRFHHDGDEARFLTLALLTAVILP